MPSGEKVGVRLQAFPRAARGQAQPTAQKLCVAMLGQPEEPTSNATDWPCRTHRGQWLPWIIMCLEKREMYIGWKFVDACLLVYIYRWRERDRYDIYIYYIHKDIYTSRKHMYIYITHYIQTGQTLHCQAAWRHSVFGWLLTREYWAAWPQPPIENTTASTHLVWPAALGSIAAAWQLGPALQTSLS